MPDNITELQNAIRAVHGCESERVGRVRVYETFDGKTAWEGTVYVFKLIGHPKAKLCYAWSAEEDGQTKVTTVLGIPPVSSAETAVKVAIASKARQ